MSNPHFAFFEGQIVPIEQAKISVMTHALHYGTAAFAGLRGYWNNDEQQLFIFRPLDHFVRLLNSAKLLLMNFSYTPEQITQILVDLLRREDYHEDVYIRPLIYKSSAGIGVRLHDLDNELTMFAMPHGDYLGRVDNIRVCVSSWRRVDDNAIPARGKLAGAYVNSALVKTDAVLNGYDEALVLTQDGHVAEGSAENFFILRNGTAITPPITSNILEGITRRTVITLLTEALGVPVLERDIDRSELYIADEAFFCGTGVQIAAISEIDRRPVANGKTGEITGQLRALFADVVRGKVPAYRHLVYPVYADEPIHAPMGD
ncbi:MAG: branched-chain amino acid transaminase [Aggregatilineales bacterium]